jgi:hypothetical protein
VEILGEQSEDHEINRLGPESKTNDDSQQRIVSGINTESAAKEAKTFELYATG